MGQTFIIILMKTLKAIYKKFKLIVPNEYLLRFEKMKNNIIIDHSISIGKNDIFHFAKTNFKPTLNFERANSISSEKNINDDVFFSSKIEGINLNITVSNNDDGDFSKLVDLYNFLMEESDLDHEVLFEIASTFNELKLQENDRINGLNSVYRDDKVGIYKSGKNAQDVLIHQGIDHKDIPKAMEIVFNIFNNTNSSNINELIISAANSHALFEFIHPYFDGNGRIGRMLMFWILNKSDDYILSENLSRVIYANRSKYYNSLFHTQKTGILNYFYSFLHEAIVESNEIARIVDENNKGSKLTKTDKYFFKELLVSGMIENQEITYNRFKESYGKEYAKTTFFRNINSLMKKNVITVEIRNNKNFYRLNNL